MEYLLFGAVAGAICAAIASSKGRSTVGWFFFGFFFHVLAIFVALVVSDEDEAHHRRVSAQSEQRRLQEQLRQERMKNEAFRRHAAGRLDAHDRVLGVNTRPAPELASGDTPPGAGLGVGARSIAQLPPPVPAGESHWFYLRGDEQKGPVPQTRLTNAFHNGRLPLSTLVWSEGMQDWERAADVRPFGRGHA